MKFLQQIKRLMRGNKEINRGKEMKKSVREGCRSSATPFFPKCYKFHEGLFKSDHILYQITQFLPLSTNHSFEFVSCSRETLMILIFHFPKVFFSFFVSVYASLFLLTFTYSLRNTHFLSHTDVQKHPTIVQCYVKVFCFYFRHPSSYNAPVTVFSSILLMLLLL